jgi:hypothetical protein
LGDAASCRDELLTELASLQTTGSEGKRKGRRRARAADQDGGAESGQETDGEEGGADEKPYYSSMLSEDLRMLSALN